MGLPMTSPARTRRLEARLDPATDDLIAEAARLLGQSRSSFVVASAKEKAEAVVARSDRTLMSARQFDALIASLDQADAAPRLAAAFTEKRAFARL
jgi:uncharacterized protein (DUF1778 family)